MDAKEIAKYCKVSLVSVTPFFASLIPQTTLKIKPTGPSYANSKLEIVISTEFAKKHNIPESELKYIMFFIYLHEMLHIANKHVFINVEKVECPFLMNFAMDFKVNNQIISISQDHPLRFKRDVFKKFTEDTINSNTAAKFLEELLPEGKAKNKLIQMFSSMDSLSKLERLSSVSLYRLLLKYIPKQTIQQLNEMTSSMEGSGSGQPGASMPAPMQKPKRMKEWMPDTHAKFGKGVPQEIKEKEKEVAAAIAAGRILGSKNIGSGTFEVLREIIEVWTKIPPKFASYVKRYMKKYEPGTATRLNKTRVVRYKIIDYIRKNERGGVTFVIDVSGSISPEEYSKFLNIIKRSVLELPYIAEVTIIPHTDKVIEEGITKIEKRKGYLQLKNMQFNYAGGTSYVPVAEYIKKHKIEEPIIWLTDGYGDLFELNRDILFVLPENSSTEEIIKKSKLKRARITYL